MKKLFEFLTKPLLLPIAVAMAFVIVGANDYKDYVLWFFRPVWTDKKRTENVKGTKIIREELNKYKDVSVKLQNNLYLYFINDSKSGSKNYSAE